jgi:hypothetical protein
MAKDEVLATLFAADAGVWEGYTVREHTLMVLGLFEKYFVKSVESDQVPMWRFFLALHDIGKPRAVQETGSKERQSVFTVPILKAAAEHCHFSQYYVQTMVELEQQEIIGPYFKDEISTDVALHDIKQIAQNLSLSSQQALQLITIYYICDAGAYSEFAGGKYSLDYVFEVDEVQRRITFSKNRNTRPHYAQFSPWEKYLRLVSLIDEGESE